MATITHPPITTATEASATRGPRIAASIGRVSIGLGVLALLGAWLTELTDSPLLGLSQQHLFFDAIALTILGVAFLVDSLLHARGI